MLRQTLIAFVMILVLSSCVQQPDFEKERQELLQIHQADREAHFNTDVDLLLSNTSDQFITVRNGTVDTLRRTQLQSIFKSSFEGVRYYEWDDLNPPMIRISRGGTMAWMITRLKVRYVRQDTSGNEEERAFVYAGIMTYEKLDGKWVRTANVSTFE